MSFGVGVLRFLDYLNLFFFVKQYCLLSALNGMKYISEWSSYWKIIQNGAKRKLYKRNENHIGFLVVPIGFWKLDPYTIDVYLSPYVKNTHMCFFFLSFQFPTNGLEKVLKFLWDLADSNARRNTTLSENSIPRSARKHFRALTNLTNPIAILVHVIQKQDVVGALIIKSYYFLLQFFQAVINRTLLDKEHLEHFDLIAPFFLQSYMYPAISRI